MRVLINQRPQTFYDVYIWYISPKLKKIDLFLKTSPHTINPDAAAELLELPSDELLSIMREEGVQELNRFNFIRVMRRGSNDICHYVDREVRRGSPFTYTEEDIAYIYDLNIDDVKRAYHITGIKEATAFTLPYLFYHIPVL